MYPFRVTCLCLTVARLCALSVMLLCLPGLTGPKAAAASPLPQATVPGGLGVSAHFEDEIPIPAAELSLLQNSGYAVVRTDLPWSSIEYTPGKYNFTAYDQIITQLTSIGIRPLLILDHSCQFYDGDLAPYDAAGQTAFANFAYAAAQHYAGKGVIWEIWNEPNLLPNPSSSAHASWQPTSDANYWKWTESVNTYVSLLRVTVPQIRNADPNATILAGVTSGLPQDYIEALLRSGALSRVDALSVHPYRASCPETVAADYSATRALIARCTPAGQSPLPLVASEWGYSTTTDPKGGGISEAYQAAYAQREYLADLAAGVNLSVFYDWKDNNATPDAQENRYGVITHSLQPKAAYTAVQTLANTLRGYRFCHRLATGIANEYKLLFQGPSDLVTVDWMATDPGTASNPSAPLFSHIAPGDAAYTSLQYAADIQFPPDTRVATTTSLSVATPQAALPFTVTNPSGSPATLVVSNNGQQASFTIPANANQVPETMILSLSTSPGVQPVDLSFFWNNNAVPAIVPPSAVSTSLFTLTPYPSGSSLAVDVTNPLTTSFTGHVVYQMAGGSALSSRTIDVNALEAGATTTVVFSGSPSQAGSVQVTDNNGTVWGRCSTEQYVADTNWPSSTSQPAPYVDQTFADTGTTTVGQAATVATGVSQPAPVAVALNYTNSWNDSFDVLTATGNDPIPRGANALLVWVLSDGSGLSYRARFTDSSTDGNGQPQTFQPDGGPLDYTGWHLVSLALDGSTGPYWDGASDGFPHGQTRWSQIALADGHGGIGGVVPGHSGVLDLAAPSYAFPSFGCSYHTIVNVNSNDAVVVSGGSTAAGASLIQGWTNGTANGLWKFVPVGSGKYQIVNQNSGLLINIKGASTASGTALIQYSNDGNLNSQWYIVPLGGSRYRIVSAYDNQLMDVSGSSTVLFAGVDQATSNGSPSQQWYIY